MKKAKSRKQDGGPREDPRRNTELVLKEQSIQKQTALKAAVRLLVVSGDPFESTDEARDCCVKASRRL